MFPRDLDSIQDVPWDLAYAIEHAIRICHWQENLLSEDMPPHWMLPFDEELTIWFEEVEARREQRYGSSEGNETTEMMSNEYADEFR